MAQGTRGANHGGSRDSRATGLCPPLPSPPRRQKLVYGTPADAREAMRRITRKSKKNRNGKMNVYACGHCSGWHTGHTRKVETK